MQKDGKRNRKHLAEIERIQRRKKKYNIVYRGVPSCGWQKSVLVQRNSIEHRTQEAGHFQLKVFRNSAIVCDTVRKHIQPEAGKDLDFC